jgi:hypothetical protein
VQELILPESVVTLPVHADAVQEAQGAKRADAMLSPYRSAEAIAERLLKGSVVRKKSA